MKTKIKRHSRSVLSVILAVCLLVTSSVAVMLVSNAVIDPSEPIAASVVEEGVVGAADDNDEAVSYGGAGQWGLWIGTSDSDGMSDYLSLSKSGSSASATKTLSRSNYFMSLVCGYTENWHYNFQWNSQKTATNNCSQITGVYWGSQNKDGYIIYRLQIWCNTADTEVRFTVDTDTKNITIDPVNVTPDVASSASISASPTSVTSSNPRTVLTGTANTIHSNLSSANLTYTFYAGDTRLGAVNSKTGSATYNVNQTDAREVNYKVVVSYTGYNSKTSGTVTVTNTSITSPAFRMWGASSDFGNNTLFDQTDSGCGPNVYYKEVTVTETGENKLSNRFKLKRESDSHYFSLQYNDDSHGNAHYLVVDGDPYTAIDNNTSQDNYLVFNPTTTGTYRIFVDQTDLNAPKVWVEGDNDLYITTETTFHNYITHDAGSTIVHVTSENKSNFESSANTGFKGYKIGNIWSANELSSTTDGGKPFMISSKKGIDYDVEYFVRDDLCAGVTLSQEHVMVDYMEDGDYAQVFHIYSNSDGSSHYAKNIILHIDQDTHEIWATATFDQSQISTKTTDSNKTVRYYFAVADPQYSDYVSGGNLHIHYWNNSLPHGNWGTDGDHNYYNSVTAVPVDVNGNTTSVVDKTGNKIYVDMTNPAAYTITDTTFSYQANKGWGDDQYNRIAYIYCADIPVWATSFAFANADGFSYCKYTKNAYSQRGIVLNPNRVYLAYNKDETHYITAVRLDQSLWSQNTEKNADEDAKYIKNFKTNLIKYNGDTSKNVNPAMNKALRNEYASRGIANELYFGGFWDNTSTVPEFADSVKPITWKVWNNLAQRASGYDVNKFCGNIAYYASVWDLAGNVLDRSKTNNLGGYYLTDTYQKDILPFFDYNTLYSSDNTSGNSTIGTVYKNVDFPFYKTTYNGITSYSYDSMSDYNREYNTSTGKYTYTGYKALNNMQGYQPFSNQAESFGNEFDINFYMTSTGYLRDSSNQNQDIVFNFSGDDDVWVYIDGVKVLDLGGAHMISAGSINLSQMKAYYKTPAKSTTSLSSVTDTYAVSKDSMYVVDLAKLFDIYGVDFDPTDASTHHTLQMFYLERGQLESNCSISFNLPQNSGLRIQTELDTSGVNPGLVAATMTAADKDYISYYIESKKATAEQRTSALNYSAYGVTDANFPAVATGLRDATFYTDTPYFPVKNSDSVYRKDGTSQLLLASGISNGTASRPQAMSGDYFLLDGMNYVLTDAYKNGTVDVNMSGRTSAVSGANGAILSLLYGQSATFDTKITPNTWLVVKQRNKLNLPSSDGRTIIRGNEIDDSGTDASNRNLSRFYSTTYTITDDAAGKKISEVSSLNNLEEDVVAHAADNTEGYYFSNYSNEEDDSFAATYKFVNKPHTGVINVTKHIDAGSAAPNEKASFWFDVTFDDVFGIAEDSDFRTFNVKYRVYNSDGTYVDRNYDTTNGIMLRHDQTAQIVGVPAGTKYKIIERSRGGYELTSITKTSYRNGEVKKRTVITDSTQYTKPSDIDYLSKTDTGSYLADFVYTNTRIALKVNIHYYDRKIVNGQAADIDTTPTTARVIYSEAPDSTYEKTVTEGDETKLIWVDTEKYITAAVAGKITNVVDDYFHWTTNTKAIAGIKEEKRPYYTYNESTGTYDFSEVAYKDNPNYNDYTHHVDAYGNQLTSATDADRWITYTSGAGADLTDQFNDAVIADKSGESTDVVNLYNQLAQIDVWVYNVPKQYTATVHGAASLDQLNDVNNDRSVMVGKGTTGTVTDYYNTRFGEAAGDDTIDTASNIMKEYGRNTSFTGTYPSQVVPVERNIDDYHFVGWSLKADGSQIFTNDYYCGYRILSDMDLYPVYMKTPTTGFGLTILPNANDTYVASNGTPYTRLNVTYNPYNVTGDSDTNIKEIAMVNIRMADDFEVSQINLDTVREKVKEALDDLPANSYGAHTITVTVTDKDNPSADVTKPVRSEYNANELNYLVTFDTPADNTTVKLNNKNRVMLTQTYNSSLLAETKSCHKLLVLGAMKYDSDGSGSNEAEWTISNNYLYYVGGVCQ